MAHGIMKNVDKGVVGYVEKFGGTWHNFDEYRQKNGAVTLEEAKECLGYEVEKRPVYINMNEGGYSECEKMYVLVRSDNQRPIHNISVSDEYQIYQNIDFLNEIGNSILDNEIMTIESCGSLWAGRLAFVNFLLANFRVKGDESETISKLMYYNAFGGRSISACAHNKRVVCNNTMMMAEAQGAANATLRKFKHTSGAPVRVEKHLVDLTALFSSVDIHRKQLDRLAEQKMNSADVSAFLGNMFPISEDDSDRKKTTRQNRQDTLLNLFENADDLQGAIARTRYAMLQATTAFSQHKTLSKEVDETYSWFNVVSGGERHKFNHSAWKILTADTIPSVSTGAFKNDNSLLATV